MAELLLYWTSVLVLVFWSGNSEPGPYFSGTTKRRTRPATYMNSHPANVNKNTGRRPPKCSNTFLIRCFMFQLIFIFILEDCAIPPTPVEPSESWLLKVAIWLQRGAVFQHKAVLHHVIFTYSCQVASKMIPRRVQIAT